MAIKRILVCLVTVAGLISAAPVLAQDPGVTVEAFAYPTDVVPSGAEVTFHVMVLLQAEETVTVSGVGSELRGNLADPSNPDLLDTTCVVPSVHEPGDDYGAYAWGCRYRVWVEGDPGEVTDTITVSVVRADGTELVTSTTVSIVIGTSTGAIRGTLTDDVTGVPLEGVLVSGYGETGGGSETDADGRYSMDGLAPGECRLMAGNTEQHRSVYAREWWDDAGDFASAGAVTVVGGEVTTVDWSLSLGGVIEGTVTDEVTGAGLAGIDVSWVGINATGDREGPNGGYRTDADGSYRIPGLYAADYLICFHDFVNSAYARQCWSNRTDFGSGLAGVPGDIIPVEVRTIVSGIDAALTPLSSPTTVAAPTDTLPFTGSPVAAGSALLAFAVLMAGGTALLVALARKPERGRNGRPLRAGRCR